MEPRRTIPIPESWQRAVQDLLRGIEADGGRWLVATVYSGSVISLHHAYAGRVDAYKAMKIRYESQRPTRHHGATATIIIDMQHLGKEPIRHRYPTITYEEPPNEWKQEFHY